MIEYIDIEVIDYERSKRQGLAPYYPRGLVLDPDGYHIKAVCR